MSLEENKATMRSFLSQTFRDDVLRDDDDIFESGMVNSLFAMQIVEFVESEFHISVDEDDLEVDNFRSLDAIAAFIERKSAAGREGKNIRKVG